MKVIVLMGSPRKKDSYTICRLIEDKFAHSHNIKFEYIFLKDYIIEDCKGCDMCFKESEELCPCKDDLYRIKKKLLDADGIIFSSPVYAYQVPSSLKRVIDRLAYLFHRQELIGKSALTIVTSEGGGHKQVSRYLKMTACGWGCNLVGEVNVISPMFFESTEKKTAWAYSESYYKRILKNIEKNSEAFMKLLVNNSPHIPSFYDIFIFNCLRSKTFTSQADYDFWMEKGWLNSYYFYDVHINILKKGFGKIMKGIINLLGKRLKNKATSNN